MINLLKRQGVHDKDNHGLVSTSEVSTIQLEFRYLAELTDEDTYWKKAEQVSLRNWSLSEVWLVNVHR